MHIVYVLHHPDLGGGVKVVFQQANILQQLGHRVTVLGHTPRPAWTDYAGPYVDLDAGEPAPAAADLVIATFYTTIAPAVALGIGPVAHYCQGYEADFAHFKPFEADIEAAYARPLPAFAVAPWLVTLLRERFGRDARIVSPPLDLSFYPARRWKPRQRPHILISGAFEGNLKNIPTALKAARRLKDNGLDCHVTRISVMPLSAAERAILEPDAYYYRIPPEQVAALVRDQDLLIFSALPEEGFGLPLLEAMASKVPAVASRTPAIEYMTRGTVALFDTFDAEGLADAARALLTNPLRWQWARQRQYAASQRFHPRIIGRQLIEAIEWAKGKAAYV